MADNEVKAQIDKLRKTRPARALDYFPVGNSLSANVALGYVLSFLRDDLKEEARLLENAKIKGGVTIMKDRLAVAGWLELFIVQLDRESDAPTERLSPSAELGEHRPSEFGTTAAITAGSGGRCAVGNVHDASTLKCACGLDRTSGSAVQLSPSVADYLAGSSDALDRAVFGDDADRAADGIESAVLGDPNGQPTGIMSALRSDAEHAFLGRAIVEEAAAKLGVDLKPAIIDGPSNIDIPGAAEFVASLPDASMTLTLEPIAAVQQALGIDPTEQAVHDAIDQEYAHVTADPFAPIPRVSYALAMPPGGQAWNAGMLLEPVDPASLPASLSFSQATTVTDCGAKYRMQRVASLPQVPQWANVGGKAFHAAVENIETVHAQSGAPMPQNSIVEHVWDTTFEGEIQKTEQDSGMTRQQFRASGQGKEGYDWWRVEGAAMLQRYVDWRQGDGAGQKLLNGPSGTPMLEWETWYAVDIVPFKTILDSAWTNPHHDAVLGNAQPTAIIRDWKTGSMTPDDRQLCTQAWGLRKAGWQGPVLVQFFDARKGTFSEPFDPFERMTWDDVRYFVLSADAARRLPILPARPSDFCGGCSVAYACPIMSQRRAAKGTK
jgi:hypothetical protein